MEIVMIVKTILKKMERISAQSLWILKEVYKMNIFQRKYKKATISFNKKMNLIKNPVSDEEIIDAINTAINLVNGVKIIDINLSNYPSTITIKHERNIDPFIVAHDFVSNLSDYSLTNIRVYKGGRKWRLKRLK